MEIVFGSWKLREWQSGDVQSLVKYANNHKIWRNVSNHFPYPYTEDDAMQWINDPHGRPDVNFAIINECEAIGGIVMVIQQDIYCRTGELGYWLGEPFWGRGIMTAAVATLTDYSFNNFELNRLQAIVFEWNMASARVLKKNGFKLEGRLEKSVSKDGQLIDSFLYALVR